MSIAVPESMISSTSPNPAQKNLKCYCESQAYHSRRVTKQTVQRSIGRDYGLPRGAPHTVTHADELLSWAFFSEKNRTSQNTSLIRAGAEAMSPHRINRFYRRTIFQSNNSILITILGSPLEPKQGPNNFSPL